MNARSQESNSSRSSKGVKTRRRIIQLLKQQGPQDAKRLAKTLDLTAMAVRQHLYRLEEEKVVTYEEIASSVGRPAKIWKLTEVADRYFPDAHAELTVDLIDSLQAVFGTEGMENLLQERKRKQIANYRNRIPEKSPLKKRLEKLAEIRTSEGYMAEVLKQKNGSFLLVENHCPICVAATNCTGLCAVELDVFQAVLGDKATIERTEHILEGHRRCAYLVKEESQK